MSERAAWLAIAKAFKTPGVGIAQWSIFCAIHSLWLADRIHYRTAEEMRRFMCANGYRPYTQTPSGHRARVRFCERMARQCAGGKK